MYTMYTLCSVYKTSFTPYVDYAQSMYILKPHLAYLQPYVQSQNIIKRGFNGNNLGHHF